MDEDTISKNLWSTSNLITGFAVVQCIAFTYACAKPDFVDMINTFWVKIIIATVLVFVTLAETFAIWWCAKKIVILLESNKKSNETTKNHAKIISIIFQEAKGKIILIVMLLVPIMLSLYAHQLGGFPFK